MNELRLTISWIKNDDCTTDISVCGEVDSYPYFKEAFLSLDRPTPVRDITDKETSSESGANSATTTLLSNLIGIIRKSIKTGGHIISENELNKTFIFSDLIAIRKLAEIAGIEFDEKQIQ